MYMGVFFSSETKRNTDLVQMCMNAESGIYYGIQNSVENCINERIVLFEEPIEETRLTKRSWGAFNVVTSSSLIEGLKTSKSVLVGSNLDLSKVLILNDNNRPLSISGKTKIQGNCVLPKAGVKRAYVEGKSFTGKKLVAGLIEYTGKNIENENKFPVGISQQLESSFDDSTVFMNDLLVDSIQHDFNKKTLRILITDSDLQLGGYYSGNILFHSEGKVSISANCFLKDIILKANSISIENGFSGSAQFYANSEIVVENATLEYPSIVCLDTPNETLRSGIQIRNSKIIGGVLLSEIDNKKIKPGISIDANSTIVGNVFSASWTELKGRVVGQVITNSFLLKTPSSVYQNHLIDAKIEELKIEGGYPLYALNETKRQTIIKWLD